jgi:hypothetical protein
VSALLKLAERCENATGQDRELDKLIAPHAGWKEAGKLSVMGSKMPAWLPPGKSGADNKVLKVPAFTASLDAAMTLVPDGWEPVIDCGVSRRYNRLHRADLWGHETHYDSGGMPFDDHEKGDAATPALALCAAALRARAAQGDA